MKLQKFSLVFKSVFIACCFLLNLEAKAHVCQGESCTNQIPHVCGNGVCQEDCGENAQTCFVDCGPRCKDGDCQQYAGENHDNCPQDCSGTASCGDGVISNGEDCHSCPADVPFCEDTSTTTTTCPSTTTTTCPTTTTTTTCPTTTTTTTTTYPTTTSTTTTTTTTIPNQCRFYKADTQIVGGKAYNQFTEAETLATIAKWQTAASQGPSCLRNEIDKTLAGALEMAKALNACLHTNKYPLTLRANYAIGMLIGENMKGGIENSLFSKNLLNPAYCKYGEKAYRPPFTEKTTCLQNAQVHSFSYCGHSVVYFDNNCQAVDSSVATASCGSSFLGQISLIGSMATPISFIWDKDADVEQNISIVDFPLDPTKIGQKWLWKASEKTPLLVYDPMHKGNIASATQLFGNWTFGGRRVASLIDSPAKQWNNGYEALKTLDQNNDGVLSGEELNTLALWFDKNSDSISANGEVVEVASIGIKKIYFNPDRKDPITGNITASLGFEREVNGKTVKGSSVDWFAQGAERKLELLLRQNNLNQRSEVKEINEESKDKDSSYAELNFEEDLVQKSGPLTGVWKWRFENEHTRDALGSNDGFFLINDDKIEGITGYSMVETAFGDGKKVASAVLMYLIQGQKAISDKGQEIKFSTEMGNGNTVSNIAKVQDDNKTLLGESTATVKDQNGAKKTISYKWTATKYEI